MLLITRRHRMPFIAFLALLGLGCLSYLMLMIDPGPLPPTFEEYREYERRLPQNNVSLPFPEGKNGMYLLLENYSTHVGWGNLLEELIMHAFLAYSSKRALVLYEFTWDPHSPGYTKFNGKYIPSRVPVSVTLAGPIAGGTIGSEHPDVPRAVSKEFFNEVCPDKFVVDANAMKSELEGATGDQTTRAWVMKLRDVGHRCVEIPKGSSHIFDNVMFGESRLLDVWSELSTSPVLRRFAWSPLVLDAYNRNRHVFEYGANRTTIDHSGHLHGLLVVHIRRGDFKGHCKYLQKHSSGYNAFNLFPEFSDRFEPPSEYWSRTTYYTNHCYPSIKRMLFKIEDVQQRQHTLRRLHIMTNAKKPWLGRLVTELDRTSSWDVITTNRDLNLTREQKYASQALDALIAQRAEAFIGNGFSSLTSNINMLRMAGELDPSLTYFW